MGFEDMRLFAWRGALWCIASLRELTPEGWCQQVLARIDDSGAGRCRLVDWRVLAPAGAAAAREELDAARRGRPGWSWGERLRFIYLCDPTRIVDEEARTVAETIAGDRRRGVPRRQRRRSPSTAGRLALVHEVRVSGADNKERLYHHRFVWFDQTDALRGVSRPFIFERPGIEFAAGLAWHPDGKRLIISYGVGDGTAWLATVDADDVRAALLDAARLPSAAPCRTGRYSRGRRMLPRGGKFGHTAGRRRGQSSLHAQETVIVESTPEAEHEVAVEPETPSEQNPAAAVGPAPTEQDAPQSDQPPTLVLGSFGAEDFESAARAASGARPACPRSMPIRGSCWPFSPSRRNGLSRFT